MAHVRVTNYHLTTTADPETVAKLLTQAWEHYHNTLWASVFLRGTASLTDKGNHTFFLKNYNGAFSVKVAAAANGSTVDVRVFRTKTTQTTVMLIPIFPKTVRVNSLTWQVIERRLYRALVDAGYEVHVDKAMAVL